MVEIYKKKFKDLSYLPSLNMIKIEKNLGYAELLFPSSIGMFGSTKFFGLKGALFSFLLSFSSCSIGLTYGYFSKLVLNGVGFRAWGVCTTLLFDLGYNGFFLYSLPHSVRVLVRKNILLFFGVSLVSVSTVVAHLKSLRKPDIYKGKGVRDFGEEKSFNLKKKKDGK